MHISFQIRQNEESGGYNEMKAVWWRNWISTDHVRDRNKNTELFSHGKEKWVLFRFPCISQAKNNSMIQGM